MSMNRRSIMLLAAAAVVMVAAWYMLMWQPKGHDLAAAQGRAEQATSQVDELELRLARLRALSERGPEMAAELDRLRSAVPQQPDIAQFILSTNAAATAAGVDFISVSQQEPKVGTSGTSEVTVSIDVSGDYEPVLDFVDRLLEMPRVVVIDSFGVTPQGDATGETAGLTVNIGGRMFTSEVPAAETNPAEAVPTSSEGTPQ